MNIEICVAGKNTPVAESYSGLYRASTDPIVDILVREAIQNSLDAGREISTKAKSYDYISVDFKMGKFQSDELAKHLEGINKPLEDLYGNNKCSYLAIKDVFTSGLTGALSHHENDDPEGNPGNLFKLAFTIAQANKDEGAGGSCGIGKTIFYTLGNGIVIFYSRIFEEVKKVFQSRLVVCMIDVKGLNIIPDYGKEKNIGIAWWGDKYHGKENDIVPVTDEERINKFLKIFGIIPYQGAETGTTLIIPYIDEKELASRNNSTIGNTSLAEALKNSIRKWYFPRLNNKLYTDYFSIDGMPKGSRKWLKCYVNGEVVSINDDQPLFILFQALYNKALNNKITDAESNFLEGNSVELSDRIEIRLNNKLTDPIAGYLVYCYATKECLKMTPPDNNPSPREILALPTKEENLVEPIIGFCRRAGMIGSYNGEGWIKKVPDLPEDKTDQCMLCLFVLNSTTEIKNKGITLDEYLRKSELNDHKDWKGDVSDRIKRNTALKLKQAIESLTKKESDTAITDRQLIKDFTDALMPPQGFGKAPGITRTMRNPGGTSSRIPGSIRIFKTTYTKDGVEVTYKFEKKNGTSELSFDLLIRSESKNREISEWVNMGLPIPFYIDNVEIKILDKSWSLDNTDDSNEVFGYQKYYIDYEGNRYACGLKLNFIDKTAKFEGELILKIHLSDRSVKPILINKKS